MPRLSYGATGATRNSYARLVIQRGIQMSRAKIIELLRERHQRFTPLQRLLRQAANQESWSAQLAAMLPDSLKRECQITRVAGPIIVVTCRSAASATKLRFLAPELLLKLQDLASFHRAREIQILVAAFEQEGG
jgi:hypothetical protein